MKNRRTIWSAKTGGNPAGKRSRKSRLGSSSIILILIAVLTMVLTTSVYAAPEDPISQDVYVWGESYITGDFGISTEGYIWGESSIITGGDIGIGLYGYAWGE